MIAKFFICLFSVFFIIPTTSCAHPDTIVKLSDKAVLSLDDVLEDVKGSNVVFIGELHDSTEHHRAQLRIISGISNSGIPVALGLEMFQAKSQRYLDQWVSGELDENEFKKIYYDNWKIPWHFYRDILLYARNKKIPLIGLNVPPEITRQVARQGFNSLTPDQIKQLPGVSCNVGPVYEKFIRKALGAHDKKGNSFKNFCEAQMVWDTTMAFFLLEYLEKNPDHTIVVLAGGGHAWKPGIPEQLRRQSDHLLKVILLETKLLNKNNASLEDADYLWSGL
jgi:uncharacterized iron-regulated protein